MATLNDAIGIVVGGQPINDGLAKYFLSTGGTGDNLLDIERSWLAAKLGHSNGSTRDLWREFLAVPPGGSLDDALLSYWAGGANNLPINFAGGSLSPLVTFSRGSTGTYTGSDGLLKTAAVDEARFERDANTGAVRGILLEEQRTNLLLRSQEIDSASWSKSACSISANSTSAPDGSVTADKVVEDTSSSPHRIFGTSFPAVAGGSYSFSFYVKSGGRTHVYIRVNNGGGDFIAGSVRISDAVVTQQLAGAISAQPVGNGWLRVIGIGTSPITQTSNPEIRISNSDSYLSYPGDGTSGIYIWGAQLEAAAYPTSYIPTTTAAVTRAADVATFTVFPRVVRLVTTYEDGAVSQTPVTPGSVYTIPVGGKLIRSIWEYFM